MDPTNERRALGHRSLLGAALTVPAVGAASSLLGAEPAVAAESHGRGPHGRPGRFDAESPRFALAVLPGTQYAEQFGQGFYGWVGDVRVMSRALRPAEFLPVLITPPLRVPHPLPPVDAGRLVPCPCRFDRALYDASCCGLPKTVSAS